jgi:hypothetical protein
MAKSLKFIIRTAIERQRSINILVKKITDHWGNENRILELFLNAPQYSLSHPRVISLLADFLQCVNDESLLSDFDLKIVEDLYTLNLEVLPDNLSQYEDLSHFYFSVFNNFVKASETISIGQGKGLKILESLQKIKDNLDS